MTDKEGMEVKKAILCCMPYHARRALLYYQLLYPETEFFVCPAKESPITAAQIRYLTDLLNYHGLSLDNINQLTKSDASRKIDSIIREYGRIERGFR